MDLPLLLKIKFSIHKKNIYLGNHIFSKMNIIVTGASKGIGKEIVKYLSTNSEHHIFAISRDKKKLEALKNECSNPKNVEIFDCDLSQNLESSDFFQTLQNVSCIDILINNAGTLINKPFLELTEEDFKSVYDVNLFSVAKLIKLTVPSLRKSKNPHIVNIGSMGGVERTSKFIGLSAYSSSKAALANLTECLAEELKEDNIHCNCLCLGAVNTEMLQKAFPDYKAATNPEEIAVLIGDFATKYGRLMNGKIVSISATTP